MGQKDQDSFDLSEAYRAAFENGMDGILFTDPEDGGRVIAANGQACAMLGREGSELVGLERADVFDLDDPSTRAMFEQRAKTGRFRGEVALRRKGGPIFPAEVLSTLFKDPSGNLRSVVTMRDVSPYRKVEETLREHLKGMKLLSDSATRLLDPMPYDQLFAYIGEQLHAMIGRGAGVVTEYRVETNQTVVRALLAPEEKLQAIVRLLGRDPVGQAFTVAEETRNHMAAGRLAHIEGGLYEVTFGQVPLPLCRRIEQELGVGEVYGMPFVLGRDILGTVVVAPDPSKGLRNRRVIEAFVNQAALALKRTKTEEALRESRDQLEAKVKERTAQLEQSNQRYRDLAELLPEMVYEADESGKFTYANRQALDTFGYTPEDLKKGVTYLDVVVPGDHARLIENGLKVARGEPSEGHEYMGRRKDGSEFPIFIRATPIVREGRPVGFRGVVGDLTESRKAENEKRSLEEQLRQSQKMEAIGTLAGGIAHDFNNMLAVILGNAELALDDVEDNTEPSRNIEQIVQASKRARELVRQILAFSRKNEGKKTSFDMNGLVKETYGLLRGSLPSTIHLEVDTGKEGHTVFADQSQIQQVLMNLVTNGAQAMRKGGGILTIRLSSVVIGRKDRTPNTDIGPGTYVKLSVQDTGTGISEKIRDRIFEPFFTTKEPGRGTGMGLAVAYGIVTGHGGKITVESLPHQGSTFNVFLPSSKAKMGRANKKAGKVPGGRERILLVDDEPGITETTALLLRRLGYSVVTAEGGPRAWDIYARDPQAFDLVMTDQTMPDLTGVELAKKMLKVRHDMPIILFTGYSETVSPESAKSSGISEFVMKPIAKREVAETVRRVLNKRAVR